MNDNYCYLNDTGGNKLFAGSRTSSMAEFIINAIANRADLASANLSKCSKQWNEQNRSLSGLDFSGLDLSECNAAGLNFENCNFSRSVLRGANLRNSNLSRCKFAGAILDAANLHDSNLCHAELVEAPKKGRTSRHGLRPHLDEFLPYDRLLARSTNFTGAKLDNCHIAHANFTAAIFEDASITNSLIEKCEFDGAMFTNADWSNSLIYRNDIVSSTLWESKCIGAVFRSNEYLEMPVPKTIADANITFPKQLFGYVTEEFKHWRYMPREICIDYQRVLFIKCLVFSSVPLLVWLAWKYVETNSFISLIAAFGAISMLALKRYVTILLKAIFGFAFGKANDAEGLWKTGFRGRSLAKILMSGLITRKLFELKKETEYGTKKES